MSLQNKGVIPVGSIIPWQVLLSSAASASPNINSITNLGEKTKEKIR
jgi:hypothetical protein